MKALKRIKNAAIGDLVRILNTRCPLRGGTAHFFNQGQVVEIVQLTGHGSTPGYVLCKDAKGTRQSLSLHQVKPAKQAMAEREALRLLDLGNIPKPGNKSPVANRMRKHIQAYANRRG